MIFTTNALTLDSFGHGKNPLTTFCVHDHNDIPQDSSPMPIIYQNGSFS